MSLFFSRAVYVTLSPKMGGTGRVFRGLRVAFDVDKTSESFSNQIKIKIWNLSKESQAAFSDSSRVVSINAGYGDNPPLLARGDILRCVVERQGVDVITTIEAGDGAAALKEARVDQSFPPGTPDSEILKAATNALGAKGLSQRAVALADLAKVTMSGYVASGSAKGVIDEITKKNGLQWSVQNGEVQVRKASSPVDATFFLLSPETGLIGSPSQTNTGSRLTSFLLPNMFPGKGIVLRSDNNSGNCLAVAVKHSGDSHEGEFNTLIDAERI